jgi:uncharacterized membrane-anchored protein YitT (DUF2179 family)
MGFARFLMLLVGGILTIIGLFAVPIVIPTGDWSNMFLALLSLFVGMYILSKAAKE